MKWEIWWTTEGDGSEYTISLDAASRDEAEEAAIDLLQSELERGDWREEDGLTHGTAVYTGWSVVAEGERPDEWEHWDWFIIPPDEVGMLQQLEYEYRMSPYSALPFCGTEPDEHEWEQISMYTEQCTQCGVVRRTIWGEYHTPSYVDFRQIYYDLPDEAWIAQHTAPADDDEEEEEEETEE